MKDNDTVRSLALIGARVRLTELERQMQETRLIIKALQGKPANAGRARKQYPDIIKAKVVAEAKSTSVAKAAKKYKVKASAIYKWMKHV